MPDTQTQQRTWTEAPASWNIKYRIGGYDEQITLRGNSYAEIVEHVNKAREYVKGLTGAAPSSKAAADAINTEPPAPDAPQSTSPAPTAQSEGGTVRVVKMTVTPRADGKVDLAFFEDGHKWADFRAIKTPQDCVDLMKLTGDWMVPHFTAVHEYPVNCLIDWKPSANLNKNGVPYKNIVAVRPAPVA